MKRPRTPEVYFVIWRGKAGEGYEKVDVVKGRAAAEYSVERLNRGLTEQERDDGLRHHWGPAPRDEGRAWMASHRQPRRAPGPDRRPLRRR